MNNPQEIIDHMIEFVKMSEPVIASRKWLLDNYPTDCNPLAGASDQQLCAMAVNSADDACRTRTLIEYAKVSVFRLGGMNSAIEAAIEQAKELLDFEERALRLMHGEMNRRTIERRNNV